MKHKILSTILFFAVVLSGVFFLPSQAAAPLREGHYTYSVIDGEATISMVNTSISGDITIPSELGGYPVTSIGNQAFFWCSEITSITIPDSVTTIESFAFYNCTGVSGIMISDSVTSIGDGAFYNCSNLVSITIPDSVTNLGGSVFNECASLQSVVIGNGVTSIGSGAFYNCRNLTSVTLGNCVTDIFTNAFWYCTALSEITIPDCVTTIGMGAFTECSSLTNITLPESVTFIDDNAFYGCSKLEKIIIPDDVTYIGNGAFSGCSSLTSATIGSGVTTIGNWAFDNCYNLKEIVFEGDAPIVNNTAFYNISATIYYPAGNPTWTENVMKNFGSNITWVAKSDIPEGLQYSISDNQVTITGYTGSASELTIPAIIEGCPVTTIGYWAFDYCLDLTNITLPDSITAIEQSAFSRCENLIAITLPTGLTELKWGTFHGCSSLTSIVIPDGVNYIWNAFSGCTSLTYVTLPNSIMRFGEGEFYNCPNIQYNIYDNGKYLGNEENPYLALITSTSRDISTCDLHPDTKIIANGAFFNCSNLTEITIPEGVAVIDGCAFYGCGSLTEITIPGCVTYIGYDAFLTCKKLTDVYYTGTQEQWNEISINNGNDPLLSAKLTVNYCPPHTCEYSDWVVTVKPTFTSSGEQSKTCNICGEVVTETLEILVGKVHQWNIVLENDFAVNFYLQISDSIENTAKVRLIIGENIRTINVSSLDKTEDGYYVLTANISAAQMNDYIMVIVMNGKEIGSTAIYTVREYCDTILADEAHSKYHALVKEMLNYGAMAQLYFGYDAENLANEGITGVANENVPEAAEEMTVSDNSDSVNFYGASLVYRDKIAVRYYFIGDITGLTFIANGNTYTPVAKDGMVYVEIANILPQDLDKQITLTVTDADGYTIAVTYGPMNYIVRMNAKGDEKTQNLMKALFNYHLAAKALYV